MRIVHLSTSDQLGGAARAAYRLHRALVDAGVDSHFVVSARAGDDPTVSEALPLRFSTLRRRWRERRDLWPLRPYPRRTDGNFSVGAGSNAVWRAVNARRPDVVHLHWVNQGFLPVADVARLDAGLVWTLADHWPLTGGCHYPGGCTRYRTTCGACPALGSDDPRDLSARMLREKVQRWRALPVRLLSHNRATAAEAQTSAVWAGRPVTVIPLGIDTRAFRPLARGDARRVLGLEGFDVVLTFGAATPNDRRKGFDLAREALASLTGEARFARAALVTFGSRPGELPDRLGPFAVRQFGRVADDLTLNLLYAAADAVLVPSREDTGPLVLVEALACGTPVIGFRVGMTPDILRHEENGFVAEPIAPAALAAGVRWIAERRHDEGVRQAARDTAVALDLAAQVPRYREIYAEAIAARPRRSA